MRRIVHLSLLGALLAGPGLSQPTVAGLAARAFPVQMTVAQLPAAGTGSHGMRIVTNGASASDCTVGGGSTIVVCVDTGASWTVVGGGAASFADLTGQLGDAQTADGAIDGGTGGEIADASVTAADLGPDSVAASELDESAVEAGLEAVLDVADLQGAGNYALLAGATFTGVVGVDNAQGFRLFEADGNGANYVEIVAPSALTGNTTCTLENDSSPIPDSCVGDGSDGGGSVPGLTTQVVFNDAGAFGADAGLVYDKTTDILTAAGPIRSDFGSATAPAFSFSGSTNRGMWGANGGVQLAAGGINIAAIYSDHIRTKGDEGYTLTAPGGDPSSAGAASGIANAHTKVTKFTDGDSGAGAGMFPPMSSPPVTCGSANTAGVVFYDSDSNELCLCDGTSWTGLKAGGACA